MFREKDEKEYAQFLKLREERTEALKQLKAPRKGINAIQSQEQIDRIRKLFMKAKIFYEKRLAVKYGLAPLRILVDMASANLNKAVVFYEDLLLRRYWCLLYGYSKAMKMQWLRREQLLSARALTHYHNSIVKKVLVSWKLILRISRAKARAISGQATSFSPKKRAFNAWKVAFDRERRLSLKKLRSVSKRGDLCVCRYFWIKWIEHVGAERLETEIRMRSRNTWDKVRNWIKK